MSEPFIGEIRAVSWGIIPKGWASCSGQLMSIAQNQALFSILGTTYGGDGITTFALPDLRGRASVGAGNTSSVQLGEVNGTPSVTLLQTNLPQHNHALQANANAGSDQSPAGNVLTGGNVYSSAGGSTTLSPQAIGPTGGTTGHENMQPYLTINYIIAVYGIFPSRN